MKAAGEDAERCIDETTDIEPIDPYGRIKRECEQLVLSACAARGKAYIITDGEAYSTRRLYLALRQALGKPAPRVSVPAWLLRLGGRFGDGLERLLRRPLPLNSTVTARVLDSACYRSVRARQDLDFHPRYRFEDVVMDLLAPDAQG